MSKFSRITLLLCFLLAFGASDALARLSGGVDWRYSYFEQSSGEMDKQTASSFTQRYSVLYRTEGLLAAGRAGDYKFSVGAEWAAFDSDLDGTDIGKDSAKLLYEGDLRIAPGGLPFRLDAYSYDLNKVTVETSTTGSLISTGIATDIYNGQTIVSGVRFMAGIRNGRYRGSFREVLSRWPRVLLDYRDVFRRDMDAKVPVKERTKDLALVSLNKKDNWFHYRVKEYTDYLKPANDSKETVYMLGTVDHLLKRQWIDMTNWIRISVDGSLTQSTESDYSNPAETYNVNFFTTMNRNGFNASSFSSLQRTKRGSQLYQSLDVPVFINKRISPVKKFRSTLGFWQEKDWSSGGNYDHGGHSYYGKAQLEMHQRAFVTVVPSLEAEIYSADALDVQAVRSRVEVYSKLLRKKALSWDAMGSLARFSGKGYQNSEASLWEGELSAGASYSPSTRLNLRGEQYFLYGAGDSQVNTGHFMSSKTNGSFVNPRDASSQSGEGSTFRSSTALAFSHSSLARLNNRFRVIYKYQKKGDGHEGNVELSHRLDYRLRGWEFILENLYTGDESSTSTAPSANTLGGGLNSTAIKEEFMHRGFIKYKPNSYWESQLNAKLFWGNDPSGQKHQSYSVMQRVKRSFYSFSGIRRQRGSITQSLTYQSYGGNSDSESCVFSLAGEYLPTRYWRLGTRIAYYYNSLSSNSIYYSLTTGLTFPLFSANFSYNYGAREGDDLVAHRYEVSVRKTF